MPSRLRQSAAEAHWQMRQTHPTNSKKDLARGEEETAQHGVPLARSQVNRKDHTGVIDQQTR